MDAEGCFHVYIKDADPKIGKSAIVSATFQIIMHKWDKALLQDIKSYLVPSPLRGGDQRGPTGYPPPGVGKICKKGSKAIQLQVQSLKELESVIRHFQKYSLITQKSQDFKLILMVNEIMRRKEHLTEEGLRKIVAIRASMNLGLSDVLKKAFPDVVSVTRPLVKNLKVQDPN